MKQYMQFDLETKEDGRLWIAGYMYPGYPGSQEEPPEDPQFEWQEIRRYLPDNMRAIRLSACEQSEVYAKYAVEIETKAYEEVGWN